MKSSAINFPPAGSLISVIGIGASGIAASRLLLRKGYHVYLSDQNARPEIVSELGAITHEYPGDTFAIDLKSHNPNRIASSQLVVVSPGVPPTAQPLQVAQNAHIDIISEIELGLQFMKRGSYIAVTGTNGKTTTTTLITYLLNALGRSAVSAGNIGLPLCELVTQWMDRPESVTNEVAVLELSSFQLHDTFSLYPKVGAVLNLTPDHLDRYSDLDEYYDDKMRMFMNADVNSSWILNGDDYTLQEMVKRVPGKHYNYYTSPAEIGAREDGFYARASNMLVVRKLGLMPRIDLPLLGTHNVANVLAAALTVMAFDDVYNTERSVEVMKQALKSFAAPDHRLQVVGTYGGVTWINDSKATNVASTLVAVSAMESPTILLLGGRHKGETYRSLIPAMEGIVKQVIAYGEAAHVIMADLAESVPVTIAPKDGFEDVIRTARSVASAGDAILLSPACSSFDMFINYEERGTLFTQLARGTMDG